MDKIAAKVCAKRRKAIETRISLARAKATEFTAESERWHKAAQEAIWELEVAKKALLSEEISQRGAGENSAFASAKPGVT